MSEFKVVRRPGKIQLVNDTDVDASDALDVIAETDGTTITVNKSIDTSSLTLDGDVTVDSLTIAADDTGTALTTNKDSGYTGSFIDFKLNGSNRLSLSSGGTMNIPGTMIAGAMQTPSVVLSGTQYHDHGIGIGDCYLGASAPDLAAVATGVTVFTFDAATDEEVYFTYRMPNNYIDGTDFNIYVCWSPSGTSTNNFVMGCDVTLSEVGGGNGSVDSVATTVAGGGTADAWSLTNLGAVTGTNYAAQDMAACRFYRDADNGADTSTDELQVGYIVIYHRVDNLVRT